MDDPFELIEVATQRANTLRRTLERLALRTLDEDLKNQYTDAAATADRHARELRREWSQMLSKEMRDWEARAKVTAAQFTNANAQLKRSITNLEEAVDKVEGVARAIERLAQVVGIVARIAAL